MEDALVQNGKLDLCWRMAGLGTLPAWLGSWNGLLHALQHSDSKTEIA
jgi:hypothetical protein